MRRKQNNKTHSVRIKHQNAVMEIVCVSQRRNIPPKIRRFDEKMMTWYHQRGMHRITSAEDLLKQFPTFLIRIGSFTISIQSGGKKYPKGFSLTVFNPKELYVIDGTKIMKFFPLNPRHPHFIPPR